MFTLIFITVAIILLFCLPSLTIFILKRRNPFINYHFNNYAYKVGNLYYEAAPKLMDITLNPKMYDQNKLYKVTLDNNVTCFAKFVIFKDPDLSHYYRNCAFINPSNFSQINPSSIKKIELNFFLDNLSKD